MDELRDNLATVSPWAEDEWVKWFFKTFREKDHRPLDFFSRTTLTAEIEALFQNAGEDVRYRMQRGLVAALRMWDEEFHGMLVLRELAWLAGKIRYVYAVPALIKILLDNRERMRVGDSFFGVADKLIGVLTGFAVDEPDGRIEQAFDGLFHDPAVAPHFSSLLALGISICDPARFVEAFDRFYLLQSSIPSVFVKTDVIANFAEHLTTKHIRDNVDLLSEKAKDFALQAGVNAGLWKAHEVAGTGPVAVQHPPAKPLPVAVDYDKAKQRVDIGTRIYKANYSFVLDGAASRMRHARPQRRGH